MRKYWKTIIISLVIVLTIGSYYTQLARASKTDISFTLETISGNTKEIDHLIIQGSYEIEHLYKPFDLSKDGFVDRGNRSFIENFTPYVDMTIQNYIEEHRNFMRGKEYNPSQYVEDDSRIIYATIANKEPLYEGGRLKLQIDLLDKQTNDRTTFEVTTLANGGYHWSNVYDVHVEDKKIKILVKFVLMNGDQELRLYTVDVNKQQLEDDAIIAQAKAGTSNVNIVYNHNAIQNDAYYVYSIEQYSESIEEERLDITNQQVYMYNVRTNEKKELAIPVDIKLGNSPMIHEEELIIPVKTANSIEINCYNMKHNYWEEPVTFTTQGAINDAEETFLQYMDGKLYVAFRTKDSYRLLIGDIYTGKSLYEGQFVRNDEEDLTTIDFLYIEQIYTLR